MEVTPDRGEIWWVALDPTLGSEIRKTRPCLVVSVKILNERRRTIVVIPLSSSPKASPPILIPITCEGRPAVAVTDQIRAVSKERFRERVGVAAAVEMAAIEEGLRTILQLG
ncbi:MAG: type II toxin-antitoxin system PemK/MazF family toxin [Acidobacteria bacterium]|nr:type II toxin-antitoxin system PemK/MazF family toxin [Acidobacteriota bacterium]